MFTTYEYYINNYYGDVIDAPAFSKWASKASDKLQYFCSNRINEYYLDVFSDAIQNATCALAEALYKLNYAEINATSTEHGNIKSMSSGGQSVTFGNNETIYNTILGNEKAQKQHLYNIAKEHVGYTGLMYAGV